ncbi:hypothetical protein AWM68_09270 [Fictibacillus phosphorivorans]|uniref:DUF2269 family protein n=1 Tax=Fictibacillus phosphorivorans TaxID=1221500 RepID=A0A161RTL6_9BACL|nr:hypothetical protein [Fictibacillus phosphorivorans]KZE64836.1 hypothetical protein AWM68_09270 [Fictibacillus phosphorivorans]
MDFLYRVLLYIHILSVIISIGPFFILFPLIKKLRTAAGNEMNAHLSTFRFVVWLAKHAGHVLVFSGVLLVLSGPWTWDTPWILITLIILFCSLFFLARAFSPTLRKFNEDGMDKDVLSDKLQRAVWIYIALLMIMLWFMVVKPYLWW